MRNSFDLAFQNSKLQRIDQIISGIDCEQRRANLFQVRPGIVIVRRFDRVENIVRVVHFHDLLDELVECLVGFCERRCFFLPQDRIAAHEPEHFGGSAETRRLRFIFPAVPHGIVSDCVDDHPSPGAITSGNLGGQTGQRH